MAIELAIDAPTRRTVGWLTYASGIAGAVSIVFAVGMYIMFFAGMTATGKRLGVINDMAVIAQYLLALPIPFVLDQFLHVRWRVLVRVATSVGVAGMVAIIVLQGLLVAGVLTFEQEIGPVCVGGLAVAVWLVVTGYLGRYTEELGGGLLLSVLAALYVGYPIWAIWLARRLRGSTAGAAAASAAG